MRALLPELGAGPRWRSEQLHRRVDNGNSLSVGNPYCRVVEPYLTQVRGLATYTIPKANVQVSGTWSSIPGPDLAANYTVTSTIAGVGPQPLGRISSSGNVTVNLVEPGTLYAPRRNNVDFRVAKILRFADAHQVGFDIYNMTNTDVVATYNQNYTATSWLVPTAIQPARYIRLNATFDF